jgi:putative aldouronate transport system permease protein
MMNVKAVNKKVRHISTGGGSVIKVFRGYLSDWQLYVLLLPAFVYILIFAYLPMYGVQIAFKDFRTSLGIWGSPWVGMKYFIRFITFPNFWLYMKNTEIIGIYSLATFPCSAYWHCLSMKLPILNLKKQCRW